MAAISGTIGLEKSTAENYIKPPEAVFLIYRLPAWGTTLGPRVASPTSASRRAGRTPPSVAGQGTSAWPRPARREHAAQVVGSRQARIQLLVADVQGQGLAAVQAAALVLGAFREAAYDASGLAEIAARIELSLHRQPAEEEFVTAVLAEIPARGPVVTILNCGHPPPLLVSGRQQQFIETASPGLPLGLEELMVSPRETTTVSLGASGRILFYTDGISEAWDSSGQFYPLERCASLLVGHDLDAALDHLRDDVVRHVGHHLPDDAAMLLISRDATAARDGPAAGIS